MTLRGRHFLSQYCQSWSMDFMCLASNLPKEFFLQIIKYFNHHLSSFLDVGADWRLRGSDWLKQQFLKKIV